MNPTNVKRMLSIQAPDLYYASEPTINEKTIYINASSVDVIQSCLRKSHYLIERNLKRSGDESEAQLFGSAIHAGLAVFYGCDPGSRVLSDVLDAFMAYESRLQGAAGTKRSVENGRKILEEYFKIYAADPWVSYVDASGPFVERSFEVPFGRVGNTRVVAFGAIDAILKNTETGELVVCDHKTTSTLGSQFYQQVKPRTQFGLYSWAARAMGIPTKSVMMNGIQVAKTKTEFARVFADYGPEEDNELRLTIYDAATKYMSAVGSQIFPMSTSQCSSWGGCQYHEICSAKAAQREYVIQSIYGVQNVQS